MGAKDRLAELKNLSNDRVYNETVEVCVQNASGKDSKEIEEIFKEVERIRSWIDQVNENTRILKHLFVDPTFQTSRNLQTQLDSTISVTNATCVQVGQALRKFEQRVSSAAGNSTTARVAKLQYAVTRQMYSEALLQHQSFLQSYRDKQHILLQEQIRLTNLTITDEECQNLLESNNLALFVDNLEAETQEARLALRDVEMRHSELVKIENSLKEVRDMFVEMSHLVLQQQDQIDRVEYYALQATDYIELGGRELLKGKTSQSKARKKKWGLILCLSVSLTVILFILIAS